jgi:integrase
MPLTELRASHIQKYINEMIHDDLATTSIARHKTTLQSALRWAVRPMGWLERIPMASVAAPTPRPGVTSHNPRQRSPDVVIPNADEVRHFLEFTRGSWLWPMWYAGFTLGLRPSELVALTEEALIIGPSGRLEQVVINRKAYKARERDENKQRVWVVEDPKRSSYRTLLAPRATLDVLRDQAKRMRNARKTHKGWTKHWTHRWDKWLFRRPEYDGRPYDPVAIPYHLGRACEQAGVPRWKPSMMRHYCASQLLEAGLPSIRVAAWLGHRNTIMVDRTYGHVLAHVRGQEPTGAVMDRVLGAVASDLASIRVWPT